MRLIRLRIVLAKGHWERRIKGAYLKALLDDGTVTQIEVQTPDADTLYDFILTYMREDGEWDDDDDLASNVCYALICRFQPEYESMVEVSVEEDCSSPLNLILR